MNIFRSVIAFVAALVLSSSALAATEQFHLTYTFTTAYPKATTISADFTGQRNGDIITDVQFLNYSYNGSLVPTPVGATHAFWSSPSAGAQLSFSGTANDFAVGGTGLDYRGYLFGMTVPSSDPHPSIGMEIWATVLKDDNFAITPEDNLLNASWTVTAVPEPETYGMLLFGAGIVALIARRRKA